ncbi:unnamed protein product [Amoebophrya sp. A25]|nr:unnamed protein product [Amoebophrya sp. A25]|eukprot:GSA25T00018044001.1
MSAAATGTAPADAAASKDHNASQSLSFDLSGHGASQEEGGKSTLDGAQIEMEESFDGIGDTLQEFREFVKTQKSGMLLTEYWRSYIDTGGKGKISISEFCERLRAVGYQKVNSLRGCIIKARIERITETTAAVAQFERKAVGGANRSPTSSPLKLGPGTAATWSEWRPGSQNAPAIIQKAESDALTLKDIDGKAFVFLGKFMFKIVRKVLVNHEPELDWHYIGKKAGETWRDKKHPLDGIVFSEKPPTPAEGGEATEGGKGKKDKKGKKGSKGKPGIEEAAAAPAEGEAEKTGSKEIEDKAPTAEEITARRRHEADQQSLEGLETYRSMPRKRTIDLLQETFFARDRDTFKIRIDEFEETCVALLHAEAGHFHGDDREIKMATARLKKEIKQLRREARSAFPLLLRKKQFGNTLMQDDLEFGFQVMEMENPKHMLLEEFNLQDVPVSLRSPRMVGLKSTTSTRETLRETRALLDLRKASPRFLSPTGDPRLAAYQNDGFSNLMKDVKLWKTKLRKKFGNLTKAYTQLFATACQKWKEAKDKDDAERAAKGGRPKTENAAAAKSASLKAALMSVGKENTRVIFEKPPNLLPHILELSCFEFCYMCGDIFKKMEENGRLNLAAIYFALLWEEVPPSMVYNPFSRQGPQLTEWVMQLGRGANDPEEPEPDAPEGDGGAAENKEGGDRPDITVAEAEAAAAAKKAAADALKPPWERQMSRMLLKHFDSESYAMLVEFQKCLARRYGHVGKAMIALDEQFDSFRLDFKEFHELCFSVNYLGNTRTLFAYMDCTHTGFARVDVVDMRLAKQVFGEEYLDYKTQNEMTWLQLREKTRKLKDQVERFASNKKLDYYSQFKLYVRKRGLGNISRVWRKYLDTNGQGSVSFEQFSHGCTAIGYQGNTRTLFWAIGRGKDMITIDDMEPELVEDFTAYVRACKRSSGSVLKVLQNLGFRNIDEPVKKSSWRKQIRALKFMVLMETKPVNDTDSDADLGGHGEGAETDGETSKKSGSTTKSGTAGGDTKSASGSEKSKGSAKKAPSNASQQLAGEGFEMVERDGRFYMYLFEHLDIFEEKRIFPDDLLALEKLVKGNFTLGDIYAERTRALRERQQKVREVAHSRRNLMEEQIEHQRLIQGLRSTRTNGKAQVEKLFIKMERSCGSILRAWFLFFDPDNAGLCTFEKFAEVVKQKFTMLVTTEMWTFLDYARQGYLTLENFDPDAKNQLSIFVERLHVRYGSTRQAFMHIILQCGGVNVDFEQFRELCREVRYDGNPRRLFTYLDREISGYVHLSSIDQLAVLKALEKLTKTAEGEHLATWYQTRTGGGGAMGGGGAKDGGASQEVQDNPDTDSPRLAGMRSFASPEKTVRGAGGVQIGTGRATSSSSGKDPQKMAIVNSFKDKLLGKYHSLTYGWRMLFGGNNEVQWIEFHHAIKNLVNVEYVGDYTDAQTEIHGPIDPVDPLIEQRMRQKHEETEAARQEAVKKYLKELWNGLHFAGYVRHPPPPPVSAENANPDAGTRRPPGHRPKPQLKLELFDPDLAGMIRDFKAAVEGRYGTFANLFTQVCFADCQVPLDCEQERYWTREEFKVLCDEISYPRNPRVLFYYFSIDCKHLYCRNLDYSEYDSAKETLQKKLEKDMENNSKHTSTRPGGLVTTGGFPSATTGRSVMSLSGTMRPNSLNDSTYDFNLNTHRSSTSPNLPGGQLMPDLRILQNFIDFLLRKSDQNLLLGWIRFLDPKQRGKLDYKEFSDNVTALGFQGNLQQLWREIFLRLDFFSFVGEQEAPHKAYKDTRFITFDKLDPYHFLLIEAFRKPLATKYKTAQVAFEDLEYGIDDFFLLCQELQVRVSCRIPAPPAFLPRQEDDLPAMKGNADPLQRDHFYAWCQNLMLKQPRRITRGQADYLFQYLNLRKQEKISTTEVRFLDGWWKKPVRKKRSAALDMRVQRDPRRAIEAMKAYKAAEELKIAAKKAAAEARGESPFLHSKPFNVGKSDSSILDDLKINTSRTFAHEGGYVEKNLLTSIDLRSNWNPRHNVLDTDQNRQQQMLYEMIHVERASDLMKAKVQKKVSQIPLVSWMQAQMANKKASKDKIDRLQPRPPPINKDTKSKSLLPNAHELPPAF